VLEGCDEVTGEPPLLLDVLALGLVARASSASLSITGFF
jgi:hypothetical protein